MNDLDRGAQIAPIPTDDAQPECPHEGGQRIIQSPEDFWVEESTCGDCGASWTTRRVPRAQRWTRINRGRVETLRLEPWGGWRFESSMPSFLGPDLNVPRVSTSDDPALFADVRESEVCPWSDANAGF